MTRTAATLDVLCVGESVVPDLGSGIVFSRPRKVQTTEGAVRIAAKLARWGFDVGLATTFEASARGRETRARLAAEGVTLSGPLVSPLDDDEPPRSPERALLGIPETWTSRVLVVSGVSSELPRAAALCRLARSFQRRGALVIADLRSDLGWTLGRDPRIAHALLVESDVVRLRAEDSHVFRLVLGELTARRPSAVVVRTLSGVRIAVRGRETFTLPVGKREAYEDVRTDGIVAAIAAERASRGVVDMHDRATWRRILFRLVLDRS